MGAARATKDREEIRIPSKKDIPSLKQQEKDQELAGMRKEPDS